MIVLEGTEGAGKGSQKATVVDALVDAGVPRSDIITTREPGGTPFAERIRELVLAPTEELMHDKTELYLMFAARQQHISWRILPALQAGKWVVCDRFLLSSCAYQGVGRKLEGLLFHMMVQDILDQVKPDLTILLDVSPDIGLARACQRGELDRIEEAGKAFFRRVHEGMHHYLDMVGHESLVVDASAPLDEVSKTLHRKLTQWARRHVEEPATPSPS